MQQGSKPVHFDWLKNGKVIPVTGTNYKLETSEDDSLLVIYTLDVTDTGNYSCIGRNDVGHDTQFTRLTVKGLIKFFSPSGSAFVPHELR